MIGRRDEDRRLLWELLETCRGLQRYHVLKPGVLHKAKACLRAARVPVPRPQKKARSREP